MTTDLKAAVDEAERLFYRCETPGNVERAEALLSALADRTHDSAELATIHGELAQSQFLRFEMATALAVISKIQRSATCNVLETILVHEAVAPAFLPAMRAAMPQVELRGCPRARAILPGIKEAGEEDWYAEYLDLILAVKVVGSLEEAAAHIETYGSSHTDGIVSRDRAHVERFVSTVDSSVLTVNASTRLSDGGVFGLGAEIGIGTDKLHARGPMGLKELTTCKWVIRGDGDIRK